MLAGFGIGCVGCKAGNCLLKDIVAIHSLPPETEEALMARMAEVVAPGSEAVLPQGAASSTFPTRAASFAAVQRSYSPPLRALVDEHVLIKRWVALIPEVLRVADVDAPEDRRMLFEGVDFIRNYADSFHHAKEEDILFTYFDQTQTIIQAMLADHETARHHVRQLVEAIEQRRSEHIAEHLVAYGELLSDHIKKEDEILYPWMDRELTTTQVGELFSRFASVDESVGPGFTKRYTDLLTQIDETLQSRITAQESEERR
jgi:hemerythrin-like domain-containing protein